jgi:hypothetical protein
MSRYSLLSILFLLLFSGLVSAGVEQTVSPSGSSDQITINNALESVYNSGGGTVYLNSGTYNIDGQVKIGSNTILTDSPDAIIRVSASSSQWFIGQIGVIGAISEPLNNIDISGFQLDGNIENLPKSYSSSDSDPHDSERLIYFQASAGSFSNNISIHGMKLYDAGSDGIHIAFANNVNCYNNFCSDCQHDAIFYVDCLGGNVYNNQVAGITDGCSRLDNCQNIRVYNNTFFSYTGNNNNGAYEHGNVGIQAGNEGVSFGVGSPKPDSTKNIEIFDNVFADIRLQAVLLDASESSNIFVHDNKFVGVSGINTTGISVNGTLPTVEQSQQIFSSIFDILKVPLSDSGFVTQSSIYSPNETWINQGDISAWIDVVGYTGEISIGNDIYIPKLANECAIVLSGTQSTKARVVSQESSKKLTEGANNSLNVALEVKTTFEVPDSHKIMILGHTLNYTTYKQESENVTFTKTFQAPALFPAFNPPNVSVINFNGSHAIVTVPNIPGIVKIDYTYNNSTATEYRLLGYVGSATNGFKTTEYKTTELYNFDESGKLSLGRDGIYIKDSKFDLSRLNVTVITPYDSFHISHFEYSLIEDDHLKFFKWGFVGMIGFFYIYGRAIYKIFMSVVAKWI